MFQSMRLVWEMPSIFILAGARGAGGVGGEAQMVKKWHLPG